MSKIINTVRTLSGLRSSFEMLPAVSSDHERFELVVIQPVPGKKGKLVMSLSIHEENVTKAVARARKMVEGSGFVVLQANSYHQSEPANPLIINRLVEAYERTIN